jgi:hypothetical protein
LERERLNDLHKQTGKFALGIGGVPTPYDVIAEEREVLTHEDLAAERNTNGRRFVVAIAQTQGVGVPRVRGAKGHKPEVPHTVVIEGVVLFDDFMIEHR